MCGAKSLTLNGGEFFDLLMLASTEATSDAPHSVRIIMLSGPYLSRYLSQTKNSLRLIRS